MLKQKRILFCAPNDLVASWKILIELLLGQGYILRATGDVEFVKSHLGAEQKLYGLAVMIGSRVWLEKLPIREETIPILYFYTDTSPEGVLFKDNTYKYLGREQVVREVRKALK